MDDPISRTKAIQVMMDEDVDHVQGTSGREVIQILMDLPAAQPQLIHCKDCKYYHSHYCGIWSQYGTIRTKKDGYCYMAERATE